MDGEELQDQTNPKVVGSSHEALPSSNDDTSHSSISEPQPTVSSQDVSTHAIFHQEGSDVTSSCNTTNDQQPVTINNPEDVHFYQQTDHFHQQTHQELHLHQKTQHFHQQTNVLQVLYPTVQNLNIEQQQQHLPLLVQNQEQQYISQQPQPNLPQYTNRQPIPFHVLNPAQQHRQHIHRQPGPQTPHAHTLALAGKLEQIMRKKTVQFYGEIILPPGVLVPGCSIEPVPLQLATARQIADNEWERHKNQRQKLHRMYIPQGSIQIEDLFEEAKQVAQQDVRYKNREAKSEYIKKFGNIVSVIGLPGIGKSTLTKIIAKCIVKDKTMKPDTQFVFPISLKNFNPNEKITLLQFLLHDNLSEWNHSDEENKALVQFLYNNRNVVLLIDGLDELNITQAGRSCYHCQLDSKEYPEVFVKNLLMGRLLPNAAKVITSRPGQFYELHPDYRQGLVSEVHGMDKPAKKNLTKQICGEANLENVEKLLAERPNLDALCYVPVHCIHIVACLHSSVSSGHEINSMTQVFLFTLTNYKASDHVRTSMSEREVGHELVKLAHLAYKGLAQRKLVFQQADFEEVGINEQTVDIFLHTYVEKSHHLKMRILEGKKRSYFIHLIWHEFFSAGHLLLFMSEERFRRCMDTFKHPHWEVVTRFMFGICNSTSYEDLKVIFPASMIKDYKEKKEILMSLIPGQYQVPKNYGRYQIEDMVRYAGWVHEANDEEISKRFEESLPKVIHMPVPRFLTEVSDVVFALNTFTTPHSLIVNISETDGSAGESFLRGIYGSQAKIKVLDIKAVKITDSFTQALLPHLDVMDKLDLDEWCLSIQNRIILHEAIQGLRNPKSLKVNRINGDRWSKYWYLHEDQPDDVMQILQLSPGKIKRLDIRSSSMSDSTTQALLPHLDVMDKLDLDEEKLSTQNRIILHEAVRRLMNPKDLRVNDTNADQWSKDWKCWRLNEELTVRGAMKILQLSPGKIKILHMANVKITDSMTQALLPHLDVMNKLDLDEQTLSAQNRIILHEAVERLTNPQGLTVNDINGDRWPKDWKMYSDQPDDDVMQILQLPPGKIKKLNILDVEMTDSTTQALLPHLDVMDKLDLDEKKLSAQNLIILHEAVERLTNPQSLTVNNINGDRWSKYWKFYYDQPYDDVMQILQVPPGKIRVLDATHVKITNSMTQALLPHSDVMDKLNLNERELSLQNRIILHEAVERLTNQKGLTVNDIDGDQWSKNWELYKDEPDDVMQILQLSPGKIKRLDLLNIEVEITDPMTQALLPHLVFMDKLSLNEKKISLQNLIILHEAVKQLPNPQGLTVKCLYDEAWKEYEDQPDDDDILKNGINGDQWSKAWKVYEDQPVENATQILELQAGMIKQIDIRCVRMTDAMVKSLLSHLDVMDKLDLDEENLSVKNLILLHEAVERLINPQGLTVNGIKGDRWSKYWEVYEDQPDDDVMQILQLPPGKIKELNNKNGKMTDSTTQALLPHLDVMNKLDLDEQTLSAQNLIILHEAVKRLTNPQGLTVNGISGDQWEKHWKVYEDQLNDDVLQILKIRSGKIKVLEIKDVWMTDSMTQALLPHLDVMDELGLESRPNDMNLNLYMEDISRKIMDRQSKIIIRLGGSVSTCWKPLVQCLGKISKLQLDMGYISKEELQLLEEEIQQLPCPQDFTLKVIDVPDEYSEDSYFPGLYSDDDYYDSDSDY